MAQQLELHHHAFALLYNNIGLAVKQVFIVFTHPGYPYQLLSWQYFLYLFVLARRVMDHQLLQLLLALLLVQHYGFYAVLAWGRQSEVFLIAVCLRLVLYVQIFGHFRKLLANP